MKCKSNIFREEPSLPLFHLWTFDYLGPKKNVKKIVYGFLVLLAGIVGWGCKQVNIDNLELDRYEEEIVDFERENQLQGAPTGAVVFLGGAKVREWASLKSDLAGMPIKNRAFGEATLREIIHYYRRLLDPFQAEVLVMNAGANDIILGARPEDVLKSFNDFTKQMAISNRASRLIFISPIPTPALADYIPQFQRATELIKGVASANPGIEVVDVSREFLDGNGIPIPQLYESDGKRLNSTGYARLSAAVAPVLGRMF